MMAFFLFPEICVHRSFLYFALLTVPAKRLQDLLIGIRTVSTALLRILKILLSGFPRFQRIPFALALTNCESSATSSGDC